MKIVLATYNLNEYNYVKNCFTPILVGKINRRIYISEENPTIQFN